MLAVDPGEWSRLQAFEHAEPHAILGAHPYSAAGEHGVLVRAFHPDAVAAEIIVDGRKPERMEVIEKGGFFGFVLPGQALPFDYHIRFEFAGGSTWTIRDPYCFPPTLGDMDLHLFNEGRHRRVWEKLGGHVRTVNGVQGVSFAVWAPNARRVSVLGDFCKWDGRVYSMRRMGSSGVFELFIPDLAPGVCYKYEIKTQDGHLRVKSDPYANYMEGFPNHAAIVHESSHAWADRDWMERRRERDWRREPFSVYEVHLGSWAKVPEEGHRSLTYREIAPRLCEHVKRFGFTHIELMPVAEHPLGASWGYQVTGYFAPTHRYGTPDDFRYFVDVCHQNGIGVILDWVPAHFPRDDFALRRFDGTALYEHEDARKGEHPDWGTLIFNYGRNEVRAFLISNALYWLGEFHVDGLRVDAVASMLYLDYSRRDGEWLPNQYGGKENIEAIDFLREVNEIIRVEHPGCVTIAEESTSWSGVTRPISEYGGLGFTFKWNMGWMHDSLLYFSKEPIHRRYHHNDFTFAMLYEFTERFINALSHDEVVHGKRALLDKMPGDEWQKFANLRSLLAYQFTRPGKQMLFMGTELGVWNEWFHEVSLDWHMAADPIRQGLARFMEDLGRAYHQNPVLWRTDPDPHAFYWIDCNDCDNSVFSYARQEGEDRIITVLNLTPVPRNDYRIGAPVGGQYEYLLCSDHPAYGGSGYPVVDHPFADGVPWHGFPQSLRLHLPPLAALILRPVR
ncbi:MAG: 1,4-alpha-glucan branching protein GlgB [Phycisphaerae bacterium]|nr:1,4-alpha-glucan branching protein GlgB [Phycisphaerae bacterium]